MAWARTEGWERRLNAAIASVRELPYALGRNDCLRAACASVEALTGTDLWPRYAGRYATTLEMWRLIRDLVGRADFTEAFSTFCGERPVPALQARRGDILEYRDAAGTQCLAVCLGARALVPMKDAWGTVRIDQCERTWRIG